MHQLLDLLDRANSFSIVIFLFGGVCRQTILFSIRG